MSEILPLFSKVVYKDYLNVGKKYREDLIKRIEQIEGDHSYVMLQKEHGEDKKNIFHVSYSKDVLNKFLPDLKTLILEKFYQYKNEVLNYTKNDFDFTTSWISSSERGQASVIHNHHNCMFSGVYYIRTHKDAGNISFEDYTDCRFDLEPGERNIYNARECIIEPKDDMILFFPAELHHKLMVNNSDIKRLAVVFNLTPYGEIGRKGNDSYLNIAKLGDHGV